MRHTSTAYVLALIVALIGCKSDVDTNMVTPTPGNPSGGAGMPTGKVYLFMPEDLVATDSAAQVTARYTDPTKRYAHGILGDPIEAGGLFVTRKGKSYHYKLDEAYVFEDLRPRLADVDNDGELEFITIQTSLTMGASVAIYKIKDEKLQLYTASPFIGRPSRWLNIAAISDLDEDGKIEIAWVQTPHIGGILRIARVQNGALDLVDEVSGVSNHRIGSRNLCLSVLTTSAEGKTLYLPTNQYDKIRGFQLIQNRIQLVDSVVLAIDANRPLADQHNFLSPLPDRNCIFVK